MEHDLSDSSTTISSDDALRVSEARYLSIIEDQTEMICRYLPDGRLSFVNAAYARYYGKSREQLIHTNFIPHIPEPDLTTIKASLARICPQQPVVEFAHRIINDAGEIRWQRWTQRGIFTADGRVSEYQAVGFDITERKLAEMITQAKLRINEYQPHRSLDELLTKVLDEAEELTNSKIGFFHFLEADQSTLKLQTWSSRTLTSICTADGKGHQYPLASAGVWCDGVRERKAVVHNNYEELPHRKGLPPGHAPIVRELVVPIFRNDLIVAVLGVGNKSTDYTNQDIETIQEFVNLAWDIIERKQVHDELEHRVAERTAALEQTNDELKKMSFDLIWAEERERERIAGELHDQVGQSLLLAKMKIDALADSLASKPFGSDAAEVAALLESSIHDIRTLTFRIRPPILDTADIDTSLEWLCSSIRRDYPLRIDFVRDNQPKPLPVEIRYALYQGVRELLLNVAKHAGTERAQLLLNRNGQTLVVQVMDSGIGFNHSDANVKHIKNGGYGLYNVQQRVELTGGWIAIESVPGSGTTVMITVPLAVNGSMHENQNTAC